MDAAEEHEPTGEPGPIRGTADTIFGLNWLPQPGEHLGFTLWRAAWAVTVTVLVTRCADLTGVTAWAVLLVVTMWAVLMAGTATAFVAGVTTWLLGTGFVVHRLGDLSFAASDRLRLAVTVLMALGTAWVGRRATARARRPAGAPGASGVRQ